MKNSTIIIAGSVIAIAIVSFALESKENITKFHGINGALNTGGAPAGRTGAPGEATCVACHNSGTVQDGNGGINVLELTAGGNEYIPGQVNSMQLTFNDADTKNGFQLVVLNANDEMAGTFQLTDATNTKSVTSAFFSRDYVTHTSNGTVLNTWAFDWLAPAGGGDVTFYVSTNKTNSNSATSGDVIYVSEHNFTAPDLVGVSEEKKVSPNFMVGFQPSTSQVVIDFDVVSANELSLNITDMAGKSVFFKNMGSFVPGSYSDKVTMNDLENGLYVVTLFIGNKPLSGKMFVH